MAQTKTRAETHVLDIVNQNDNISSTLKDMGIIRITKTGEKVDFPRFSMYYKIEPIIYNPNLSEQQIVNLLQGLDLNNIKAIYDEVGEFLYKDPNTLNLTDEQRVNLDICISFIEIYGISPNDEYITYLQPDFLFNRKKRLVSDKKTIDSIKENMDVVEYPTYNLSSYYEETHEIISYVQDLGIVDFSDKTYSLNGFDSVVIPSPFNYVNAATLIGISCQETSPKGTKTIILPKNPDNIISGQRNRKEEKRIPTDLVRAKMFELMLTAGYNPYTCFAIYDKEISFGHTQAIKATYEGLIGYDGAKTPKFVDMTRNSISKFFNFFDRSVFLSLTDEQKNYLQLPSEFKECVNPKDQILFSYYLALYNFKKFMNIYMNEDNMTERSFFFVSLFSKASEAERFKFVSAMTAAFHHLGEKYPRTCFQRVLEGYLPLRENNKNFPNSINTISLDALTDKFIDRLRSGADEHARTSMNVGEIVSRWQIEEELVSSNSSPDVFSLPALGDKIDNFFTRLFKREKKEVVELELEKSSKEKPKEDISFECRLGTKRNLIVQSNRAKSDIQGYEKGDVVEFYTFSYPQWATPVFSLTPVLKESNENLVGDIETFNNIETLTSTGDRDSKDPMKTAQVFWVPVDYVRFNGPELGEIIISDNTREKTITALEEFCIGGASRENMQTIQLTSNIFTMYKPNDRLLIPYSLLKPSIRKKIDANTN
ncbi:hypothetical protein KO465_01895 [Candidatus Micrarchaeota archaeon]|nr:hypothetical protein [Candidatus Micrarchaeota archaeon]